MRQCEFKKRYDPNTDMHVRKHIHGEGIMDIFRLIGRKLTGKTAKSMAKKAATKAAETAMTKTGEYAGKKAGDKIVELLSKKNTNIRKTPSIMPTMASKQKELRTQEVNDRISQLLSGGRLRRRNFI